jgi:hypothetical protein
LDYGLSTIIQVSSLKAYNITVQLEIAINNGMNKDLFPMIVISEIHANCHIAGPIFLKMGCTLHFGGGGGVKVI